MEIDALVIINHASPHFPWFLVARISRGITKFCIFACVTSDEVTDLAARLRGPASHVVKAKGLGRIQRGEGLLNEGCTNLILVTESSSSVVLVIGPYTSY